MGSFVYLLCLFVGVFAERNSPVSDEVLKYRYGVPESNIPDQFHLSFAGANEMMVAWETDTDTATHICKYGTSSNSLTKQASGFSRTYGYSYTHFVTLPSLSAMTKYYYSCGDATSGFGPTYFFTTPPAAGSRQPFNIAVIGDMGIEQSAQTSADMIKDINSFNWTLHIGDLGYADDYYLYLSNYEQVYSQFMLQIQPLSSVQAYMGLPGNHEATCNEATPFTCNNNLKNFTAYRTRWEFPNTASGGTQNMWYSFDYGMAHFIMVDTETDFAGAPEGTGTYLASGPFGNQLAWIENDLQKAVNNRKNVPWIIMSGHRPVWYSGGQDQDVNNFLLPLLTKYNVDIYYSGHEHLYERYYPINSNGHIAQSNYNNPTSPIYIVNGAAGNVEGHSSASGNPDYLAYRNDQVYGWARFSFLNVSTLHWEFFSANTNAKIDECYITKPYT